MFSTFCSHSFGTLFGESRRVGLVEVLLGLLDWRAGGRNAFCSQMKWNESEASIGRVLAIEVGVLFVIKMPFLHVSLL